MAAISEDCVPQLKGSEKVMASLELVERLRERANVSYEEAGAALDACGDELLEALIYLERQGKVAAPNNGGSYSSKSAGHDEDRNEPKQPKEQRGESFGQLMNRFFRWCGRVLHKGTTNYFDVWRGNHKILTIPVLVLIILLICAFWITLPLLVVGLFMGCRYLFRGEEIEVININNIMDSAADAADNIKSEVINARNDHNDNM